MEDILSLGIPKKLIQLVEVTVAGFRITIRVISQFTSACPITTDVKQGVKVEIRGHTGIRNPQILDHADD